MFFRDEKLQLLARRDEAILSGRPAAEVERRGIGRLELREILLEGLIDMGSCALHDRLEPAEPHPDQFPNTGLSIRPFVDHREPLRLVRAQRQNDPSSGFDLIEDRRRQSLGGGRQQGSIVGRVLAPATRPVSDADGDIRAAELAQVRFGLACCKRRSKNPSLKRPVSPVAPE